MFEHPQMSDPRGVPNYRTYPEGGGGQEGYRSDPFGTAAKAPQGRKYLMGWDKFEPDRCVFMLFEVLADGTLVAVDEAILRVPSQWPKEGFSNVLFEE